MATAVPINPPSIMSEADWAKFNLPMPDAFEPTPENESKRKLIDVGDGHVLYAREYGNPKGEPLIYLHGGPGGEGDNSRPRYYDQSKYRIIIFDQRGCGRSTPSALHDYDTGMKDNDTAHLVEDIEKVRDAFGIKGKAHITGGSWGSTLALAYAIKHPEHVKSLILFGIFLGDDAGRKFLFQGNAAFYKPVSTQLGDPHTAQESEAFLKHYNDQPMVDPGTGEDLEGGYRAYMGDGSKHNQIPRQFHEKNRHMALAIARAWDEFVRIIPENERGDIISAYVARLRAKTDATLKSRGDDIGAFDAATNRIDPDYQQRIGLAFSKWEGILTQFSHEVKEDGTIDLTKFADPDFALPFARIEATYMKNRFFLTEDGSPAEPGNNYLLDNLHRIAEHKIPLVIIHGKRDQVCRPDDAIKLRDAYKQLGGKVHFDMPEATSHLQKEKGTALACRQLIRDKVIPEFDHADWHEIPGTTTAEDIVRQRSKPGKKEKE